MRLEMILSHITYFSSAYYIPECTVIRIRDQSYVVDVLAFSL